MILNEGGVGGGPGAQGRERVKKMTTNQIGGFRDPPLGQRRRVRLRLRGRPGTRTAITTPPGQGAISWAGFFHTYFWVDRQASRDDRA